MKNLRVKFTAVMICFSLCLTAAVSENVRGCGQDEPENPREKRVEPEDVSYIVDFFDYDGNFLDSRICTYGEKLENIQTPQREEDEEYTYRFAGWEPELCQVVTESAAYMAVYEKIPKDGSDPETPEVSSNSREKILPENPSPKGPDQIYSISYEVVPIQVETPAPEPTYEPAPAITPESSQLHVGKIHNMTVPVIHTSEVVMEETSEEISRETSETGKNDTAWEETPQDETLSLAGGKEQSGTGKKKKAKKKEMLGKTAADTIEKEPAHSGRDAAESTADGAGSGAETGVPEEAPAQKKPEVSKASFGKGVHTGDSQVPISLLLTGVLGGGVYILQREKRGRKRNL